MFRIQSTFLVLDLVLLIYACISLIYFYVAFQIQPDAVVLALHIDACILIIYSCVVFQIQLHGIGTANLRSHFDYLLVSHCISGLV
jgi:hypothetical protein